MTKIEYKIEFFSEWHCGSGMAAGADLDVLVIKDKDNLPYIPGKTIKGLLRESIEQMYNDADVAKIFGTASSVKDNTKNNIEDIQGQCFFSNAELSVDEKKYIIQENLTDFLYRKVTSTAITSKGVADEHTLRSMQTVIPCTLCGYIDYAPEDKEVKDHLKNGLKMIKRLGQNRNRGLGRCDFSILQETSTEEKGGNNENK